MPATQNKAPNVVKGLAECGIVSPYFILQQIYPGKAFFALTGTISACIMDL
jgi:hypothetical protein